MYTTLPQGSIPLLRARFAGDILPDQPDGQSDAPTTAPVQPDTSDDSSGLPPQTAGDDQTLANSATGNSSSDATASDSTASSATPPEIPEEYRGNILEEDLSGQGQGGLILFGDARIKNYTSLDMQEILQVLQQDSKVQITSGSQPQVLIFHTHATESYEPYDSAYYDMRNTWRDTDEQNNMIAVGNAIAEQLTAAGIGVIHDTTLHDYPSYNGAYDRSAETVQKYLDEYPSIQVILDVHRDAIEREQGLIVKPVVEIDGKKAAQLMIIAPCDDGTMDIPQWQENFRFATAIQSQVEADYPGLMRPIFFAYRRYNMHLGIGSLLLEFGGHANTLEESVYTGELLGRSLATLLTNTIQTEE